MAEEIRFPIVGEDRGATRVLKDVARESAVTAAQTRTLAAEQSKQGKAAFDAAEFSRVLADSYDKGGRAAAAAVAATKALADADKALAKEAEYASAATVAQTMEIDRLKRKEEEAALATRELGKSAKDSAGKAGLGALAGSGGGMAGGGMAALIAAGVALAPVLVTVGTGLGGLGLAALAAGKNSKQLKAELVPLKAQFADFGKAVRPTLVTDFAAAASLAGHVLKDIRPVTVATGKAMAQFLGLLGKDLQGKEWTDFFQFMATTASPDVKLLGQNFIDLANTLPPLLKLLQPTATDLLSITDAVAKATKTGADYQASLQHTVTHENDLAKVTDMLRTVLFSPGAGLYQALKLTGIISSDTANKQEKLGSAVHMVAGRLGPYRVVTEQVVTQAGRLGRETDVVNSKELVFAGTTQSVIAGLKAQAHQLNVAAAGYEHALGPLENYINATIAEKNDLVTLNQDLKKSHDMIGLKTAAERQSFGDTQTFIDQTIKTGNSALATGKNIQTQINIIKAALPTLENVKGKTAAYRQELQDLKAILDKLRAEKLIQEQVSVSGTGHWSFRQSGVGHAVSPGGAAAGLFINRGTGPTADDVLVRASKGELIVPAKMVASGLVDHLRGSIPGFASGGIVPSYHGSPGGLPPWTSHNQAATVMAITAGIAKSMAQALRSSMGGFGVAGPGGGAPAANAALARRMMPAWGSGAEWAAWNYVAMRESGWSQYARNKSSGAYGIPQALPPSKMGPAANPPMSNPAAQISWMIGYIRSRYGDPIGAASHERSFGWYSGGTPGAKPGWAWVGEKGPELAYLHGGETILSHEDSMAVTRGYASGTGIEKAIQQITLSGGGLWADIRRILRQIRDHYTGATRRRLDRLVEQQAHDIAAVRQSFRNIQARNAYAKSVTSGLSGFADISNYTLGPGYVGGKQLSGAGVLNQQLGQSLSQLRQFASVLRRLDHLHLPHTLLRQIVALGPGPGTQYGQELLNASPGLLRKISATERAIGVSEHNIGQIAGRDIYGNARNAGRRLARERGSLVNIEKLIVSHPHDIDRIAQRIAHRITASGFGS